MFNNLSNETIRYLIVGLLNTVFGYLISVGLYFLLSSHLHILFISSLTSIITITFSFLTYKCIVFKTKGDWLKEYVRSCSVYGISIFFGILSLWILVDFFQIMFWIAQGAVLITTTAVSYLGHSNYTFKK